MTRDTIPNRSGGGTFVYDKAGNFVEHIAPTKTVEQAAQEAAAPAEGNDAAIATTTATDEAPPLRASRRNRTAEE